MGNKAGRYDLIAMGRSSIDLHANDVGAPFVEIESFAAYVGGSPTNIAVGAQRLGLRTALLTAVGEDPVGEFILHFLNQAGVDTTYIARKPGTRSSAAVVGIEPPDKFPLVFYRDNAADIQLTIDDVIATPIAEARAFELAGTNLSREPSRSATFFAAEQARTAGSTVIVDLDFRADQWHDPKAFGVLVRSILPLVDIAIGTEEEIKLAMLKEVDQLRFALWEDPTAALVVKRGAKGAAIHQTGEQVIEVPGFPVQVYNALGAGMRSPAGLSTASSRGGITIKRRAWATPAAPSWSLATVARISWRIRMRPCSL